MSRRNYYAIDETERPIGRPAGFDQPCLILWQSVIKQAVEEARKFSGFYAGRAQDWLFKKSRDRNIVFELAGMSVEFWTQGVATRLVKQAQSWQQVNMYVPVEELVEDLCERGLRQSTRTDMTTETIQDLRHMVRREKLAANNFLSPSNYVWQVLGGMEDAHC